MKQYWKQHKFPILFSILSAALYFIFAYKLIRTDFFTLITLYGVLFCFYFALIRNQQNNFTFLLIAGIFFRLIFITATPNLSQDFYRFIWDGRLSLQGINPYLYTPDSLTAGSNINIAQQQELHNGMGWLSAMHFSNYPPLSQFYFAFSAYLGGKNLLGSIIVMRVLLIISDIGIVYFGRKILNKLSLPLHQVFWYFLNPLVIIELTGNLHFEGFMLFFFAWGIHLLFNKKWWQSAIVIALSISIKLIPLIFLPLLIKKLKYKILWYYIIIAGVIILLFVPFFSSSLLHNYSQTTGLWFTNFEFNASLFNIVKKIGYWIENRNTITSIGKITPFIILIFVMAFSLLRDNKNKFVLLQSMLFTLSIYYFTATTVHPWYITFLIFLSILTPYRYPIIWSATIMLSYWAYSQPNFKESGLLLFLEYSILYGYLFGNYF